MDHIQAASVNAELYQLVVMIVGLALTALGALALSFLNSMKKTIESFRDKQEQTLQQLAKHETRLDSIVSSGNQREESLMMLYTEKLSKLEKEIQFSRDNTKMSIDQLEDKFQNLLTQVSKLHERLENSYKANFPHDSNI